MSIQRKQNLIQVAGQRHARFDTIAIGLLAGTAILSSLLFWIAFTQAFDLSVLAGQPLFDLWRRSLGRPNTRWWLLFAFLIQFGLYWLGWRTARFTQSQAAWTIVLGGAAVSAVVLMFMFPFGAADIFDYIMHGRILSIHGANPFVAIGKEFPADPFLPYMGWNDLPSTYGPIWTLLCGAMARLAGKGVIANVLAFKLLAGVFFCGAIAVVADMLRRVAPDRVLPGVVLLAWNPVVLYETFGNGHNDMAMIFWVLAAANLITRRRYTLAILALVMGALFKYIPILLLPAAGLIALRELPGGQARLRFVLVTGLAAAALVVLAYLPFWDGPESLAIFRRSTMYTTSLPALVYALLQPAWGEEPTRTIVSTAAGVLTILFALWQGVQAWRDRSWRSFPRAVFWVALLYLLCTCLWFQEWYTIWPLALAAVLLMDRAVFLACLLNIAGLLKPLIFVPLWLWRVPLPPEPWRELRLGPAVLALPWLALLIYLAIRKRRVQLRINSSRVLPPSHEDTKAW